MKKVYLDGDYVVAPSYHGVLHPYFWSLLSPKKWVILDPSSVTRKIQDYPSIKEEVLEKIKAGELYLPEGIEVPPPEYKIYYSGGGIRVLLSTIHGYLHPLLYEPTEFLCEERLDWDWGVSTLIEGKEYYTKVIHGIPSDAMEIEEKIKEIIEYRRRQPLKWG